MLLLAAPILAFQHASPVRYHTVMSTEAKSPQMARAVLIQDKRKAFEFRYLVKDGYPKPKSIEKTNWHKSNVLIIYPGLIQRDATVKLASVNKTGHTIKVTIDTHHGMSAETHYPIIVLIVPRQDNHTELSLTDLGTMRTFRGYGEHARHRGRS